MSRCPKCGDPVFFIRHNGGSVWLDPPLSPPWFKHPCFESTPVYGGRKKLSIPNEPSKALSGCKLGVVVSGKKGRLRFITDDNIKLSFLVTGNPAGIVGEICAYNEKKREVWSIRNPKRVFSCIVDKKIEQSKNTKGEQSILRPVTGYLICSICNSPVKGESRLVVHLRKVHNLVAVSLDGTVMGVMALEENKASEALSRKIEDYDINAILGFEKRDKYLEDDLASILRSALESVEQIDGWIRIDKIGKWIKYNFPEFKTRKYGYKKLAEMLRCQPFLEVREELGGGDGTTPIIHVRITS